MNATVIEVDGNTIDFELAQHIAEQVSRYPLNAKMVFSKRGFRALLASSELNNFFDHNTCCGHKGFLFGRSVHVKANGPFLVIEYS